ncbi:MAG: rRNA pseudouridine synthase [Alphaproteobacteria bacterium]|nr:rRNA pseudouridine synthase [Alphaproteobacteria bacterium]
MTKEPAPPAPEERIAKVLARRGVASRRAAEALIAQGRVAVEGTPVTSPATKIDPDAAITVDGVAVADAEAPRLWRYHKPSGLVTTHRDPQGRPTVFERLPEELPRVVSVGRLDLTSEGLLLLTNDGGLARTLELPATGWTRRYRARVYGRIEEAALARLAEGVEVEGVRYGPVEAKLERETASHAWLAIGLKEGKNREVRRLMEHLGLKVTRLIRTAYGPFQLGGLPPGEVEEVKARVLRDQLGGRLAPRKAKRQ